MRTFKFCVSSLVQRYRGVSVFQGHVVSINLVKLLTSDILLQSLKQRGQEPPEQSKALSK